MTSKKRRRTVLAGLGPSIAITAAVALVIAAFNTAGHLPQIGPVSQQIATEVTGLSTVAPFTAIAPSPSPTQLPAALATPGSIPILPVLVDADVMSGSIEIGKTLTLIYEIQNDSGAPLDAVLGATIHPAAGGQDVNDPANDQRVSLKPGTATYYRNFHIPATTAAGDYDVLWGVWSQNAANTGYGTKRQPRRLQVMGVDQTLIAAALQVSQIGYTVQDENTYDTKVPLRVLIGTAAQAPDGPSERAFFFREDQYLGTDTKDPSAKIQVVARGPTTVALRYAVYRPEDDVCCPTGSTTVRYQLSADGLKALDAVPPADPSAPLSRR